MSVLKDCDERGQLEYQRLLFVEFLEFIARLAVLRFNGTELEDFELKQKVEFVMDDIFKVVGESRVEV